MKQKLRELFLITVGSFLYAVGINYFFVANKLAEGGVTGISLIIYYLTGISVSLSYLVINIPLVILGWKLLGKKFVYKTIYGIGAVTLALKLTSGLQGPMEDLIVVSIFGGITIGTGLGIIFYAGGSTGGIDILARILKTYKGLAVGKAMFIMDFLVLCMVAILFGKVIFMYTLIATFICTKVIDFIQDGITKAKGVMIITEKSDEIKEFIMVEMGRGITIFEGKGGFTSNKKEIVYCVVSKLEIFRLKQTIKKIDPKAFVTITDVSETLGEGFGDLGEE
ncbi:YitT family protein [Cetobacterium sp. 2A]|uniref:YitT family protein n=1 Tax=Cetobacterium sp. 2A TaxID=2754723 RepID=UPI00163B98F6|nr:YitT family protein [Cetobacterium sp. 2A]MBC2857399.1 YitT family protein [Cetobacterium sp. 2A]